MLDVNTTRPATQRAINWKVEITWTPDRERPGSGIRSVGGDFQGLASASYYWLASP